MNLSELTRISFRMRVTCIERQEIDRLISLANEFSQTTNTSALALRENGEFTRALSGLYEAAKTNFCLYCLAIINCYSFLENNRNEILGENFSRNRELDSFLKKKSISHDKVRCYKTMDEFRQVNNAIKHSRLSGATFVVTKNKKIYGPKQMKALYKKSIHLDSYLADLYKRMEKIHNSASS